MTYKQKIIYGENHVERIICGRFEVYMYSDSTLMSGIEVSDKAVRISSCTPDFELDFSVASYDRYITPT